MATEGGVEPGFSEKEWPHLEEEPQRSWPADTYGTLPPARAGGHAFIQWLVVVFGSAGIAAVIAKAMNTYFTISI